MNAMEAGKKIAAAVTANPNAVLESLVNFKGLTAAEMCNYIRLAIDGPDAGAVAMTVVNALRVGSNKSPESAANLIAFAEFLA